MGKGQYTNQECPNWGMNLAAAIQNSKQVDKMSISLQDFIGATVVEKDRKHTKTWNDVVDLMYGVLQDSLPKLMEPDVPVRDFLKLQSTELPTKPLELYSVNCDKVLGYYAPKEALFRKAYGLSHDENVMQQLEDETALIDQEMQELEEIERIVDSEPDSIAKVYESDDEDSESAENQPVTKSVSRIFEEIEEGATLGPRKKAK